MFVGGDWPADRRQFLYKLSDKIVADPPARPLPHKKSLADRVLRNKNIEVRFNTRMLEIKGIKSPIRSFGNIETKQTYEEETDAVFVFVGSIPDCPWYRRGGETKGSIDQRMESSIKGLIGDVRATPFRGGRRGRGLLRSTARPVD